MNRSLHYLDLAGHDETNVDGGVEPAIAINANADLGAVAITEAPQQPVEIAVIGGTEPAIGIEAALPAQQPIGIPAMAGGLDAIWQLPEPNEMGEQFAMAHGIGMGFPLQEPIEIGPSETGAVGGMEGNSVLYERRADGAFYTIDGIRLCDEVANLVAADNNSVIKVEVDEENLFPVSNMQNENTSGPECIVTTAGPSQVAMPIGYGQINSVAGGNAGKADMKKKKVNRISDNGAIVISSESEDSE